MANTSGAAIISADCDSPGFDMAVIALEPLPPGFVSLAILYKLRVQISPNASEIVQPFAQHQFDRRPVAKHR